MKPVRQSPPTTKVFFGLSKITLVFKIIIFDDQKVTDMSGKDSADHINSCNYLRWGMRSRMPVRMVSTMANWESRPKVKSMAKKRIAHNVGNGNRVTRSG